ncbi:uncharacterized protein METZ01_LOCUS203068 [marine metagenome]|uniref:Uncharacterized protein n=1 Tax=marine metagenome TaxID=408172 RepID=A0A382EJH7_9ZZZZ
MNDQLIKPKMMELVEQDLAILNIIHL